MAKKIVFAISFIVLLIISGCATSISTETAVSEDQLTDHKAHVVKDFTPLDALNDPDNRVDDQFSIAKGLQPRVHFWFNIYTKYGSSDHVIHHSRYPWIVFKVVSTEEIDSGPGHRWTKYHRSRRLVKRERRAIRRALLRLSKKRSYRNLKGLERQLYNRLKWVRGKRSRVFKFAASHVRSQLGQKDFYKNGLQSSRKYFAFMNQQFSEYGLPEELTRLPFVESSFNIHAQSAVGASGIWQIMPRTGASYGKVGKYIDERNSPYKSTQMAARLLRFYYRYFKSWPLAVTAYNNGIGGMKRAIARSKSRDLHTIIKRTYAGSFKFASANFYSSFLAALHAYAYRMEIFEYNENREAPFPTVKEISLSKRFRPKTLIKLLEINKDLFLKYNLDLKKALRRNVLLPRNLKIYLPESVARKLEVHLARKNSLKEPHS